MLFPHAHPLAIFDYISLFRPATIPNTCPTPIATGFDIQWMLELVALVHVGMIAPAHLIGNPRKEIQHALDAIVANDESIALSLTDENIHFISETAVVAEMLKWEPPPIVG